jgi:DNA transposition AAA+ family ATPase
LIIVDEADRLKLPALEQLRSIFDEEGIALILIGMPGIQKRLSRFPQLYSRVGFVHEFKMLSRDEVIFLLDQYLANRGDKFDPKDFTDSEDLSAIIRITQGNFRLFNRLLLQIKRILEINGLTVVSKEVVEAARNNLVIGRE